MFITFQEENHTFGSTRHCDRHFAVSKEWDAAAAIEPENPAARLTAKGCNGPISSSELKSVKKNQTYQIKTVIENLLQARHSR